jgi:hypothetical protein
MHRFSTWRLGKRAGMPIAAALLLGLPMAAQAAAAGVASATTSPHAALTLTSTSLGLDGATVTTANGTKWYLTIGASNASIDGGVGHEATMELARQAKVGGRTSDELHAWTFNTSATTFKFSTTTGDGTVDTGSLASPVAMIDVKFTATAHTTATCLSGKETLYTGTLSGEAKLVTGLSGGGTVGGSSVAFRASIDGSKPTVTVDDDCTTPFPCPTSTEVVFAAAPKYPSPLFVEGGDGFISGKNIDLVTISNDVTLSSPKGATRDDDAFIEAAPSTWDQATKTLKVTTSKTGIVTGSAVLVGGKSSSFPFPCTVAGKSSHVTETGYTAKFSSPAGHAITAHNKIGGTITFPTKLNGSKLGIVVNIDIVAGK